MPFEIVCHAQNFEYIHTYILESMPTYIGINEASMNEESLHPHATISF